MQHLSNAFEVMMHANTIVNLFDYHNKYMHKM